MTQALVLLAVTATIIPVVAVTVVTSGIHHTNTQHRMRLIRALLQVQEDIAECRQQLHSKTSEGRRNR